MRHLPAISIYGYVVGRQIYALWALEWAWQTFFWVNRKVLTRLFQLNIFFFILSLLLFIESCLNFGTNNKLTNLNLKI